MLYFIRVKEYETYNLKCNGAKLHQNKKAQFLVMFIKFSDILTKHIHMIKITTILRRKNVLLNQDCLKKSLYLI